jgi:hypothetical protein
MTSITTPWITPNHVKFVNKYMDNFKMSRRNCSELQSAPKNANNNHKTNA